MTRALSFALLLTFTFQLPGFTHYLSWHKPAPKVKGWHCGMKLCLCDSHRHADPAPAVRTAPDPAVAAFKTLPPPRAALESEDLLPKIKLESALDFLKEKYFFMSWDHPAFHPLLADGRLQKPPEHPSFF